MRGDRIVVPTADESAQRVSVSHSGASSNSTAGASPAHDVIAGSRFISIAPALMEVRLFRQVEAPAASSRFRFFSVMMFFISIFLSLLTHAFDYTRSSRFVAERSLLLNSLTPPAFGGMNRPESRPFSVSTWQSVVHSG